MPDTQLFWLILITCSVAGIVILIPCVTYLFTDWKHRRDYLYSLLSDESMRLYYERFYPHVEAEVATGGAAYVTPPAGSPPGPQPGGGAAPTAPRTPPAVTSVVAVVPSTLKAPLEQPLGGEVAPRTPEVPLSNPPGEGAGPAVNGAPPDHIASGEVSSKSVEAPLAQTPGGEVAPKTPEVPLSNPPGKGAAPAANEAPPDQVATGEVSSKSVEAPLTQTPGGEVAPKAPDVPLSNPPGEGAAPATHEGPPDHAGGVEVTGKAHKAPPVDTAEKHAAPGAAEAPLRGSGGVATIPPVGPVNPPAQGAGTNEDIPDAEAAARRKQFRKDFGRLYGRRHYVLPLVLLGLFTGLGMWATAGMLMRWLNIGTTVGYANYIPPIVIAAFLGAYVWVLLDQISRNHNRNLTRHDVYRGVYRLLIAIPLGMSLAKVFNTEFGVMGAFLLGTFPTQTLLRMARRRFVDKTGLGEQTEDGPTELAQLQGIDKETAERLRDVGLTTVVDLAWRNPVELTIRTNFSFDFVIDCISQALVWVYFGEKTKKLYHLSLRGAQEVRHLWMQLSSDNVNARLAAEQVLKDAATLLEMDSLSLRHTLDQIADDPYTQFLWKIWASEA